MSIQVKNLKHIYEKGMPGESVALEDITFSVEDGEFLGIIGHTGSGKSTLLQHLNGLLKPDEGTIETVSYTHLDVYKRQVLLSCVVVIAIYTTCSPICWSVANAFIKQEQRNFKWMVAGMLILAFIGSNLGSVSYTHLDVYKRQRRPS